MSRLKIELHRIGRVVTGWVLEQSEDLREKNYVLPEYGFFIRDRDRKYDDRQFSHTYSDEDGAIAACNAIKAVVDEVNAGEKKQDDETFEVGNKVLVYDSEFNCKVDGTITGYMDEKYSPTIRVRLEGEQFRSYHPQQLRHVERPATKPRAVVSEVVG